jgi:hypothetical protein
MTALALAVAVPVKTALAKAQELVSSKESGLYTLIALDGRLERKEQPIWPYISRKHTWQVLRANSVYDSASDLYWIKLPTIKELTSGKLRPAGGLYSIYYAACVVCCLDGKVSEVLKNKRDVYPIPPKELHTTQVPKLMPRFIFLEGQQAHISIIS